MSGSIRYFLFIALFGISVSLNATHNRAGEITYTWLGGYTYSVTLVTYTDDGPNVADRCQMKIFFGDGDSCMAYRENGPLGSSTSECSVSHLGEIINAANPRVKKNVYSCTHTYSGTGTFKIYIFDTNRNAGVINIPNSVNQPFYIESLLVIGSQPNNSSLPGVNPIDQAALYKVFYHNRGAYDVDGDSLSFELIFCKGEDAAGNIGVPIPGYSYPSPGPSGNFSIDSLTGTITWSASQSPGEYNIAFLTKEWRKPNCSSNYVLVGYVTRDMQVLANSSSDNLPVFSVTSNTCIEAGTVFTSTIGATDPENNVLDLSAYGAAFNCATPVATFSSASSVNATGGFSWNTACSNIRKSPYTITYRCSDSGSPYPLVNFTTQNVTVIAPAPQNLITTSGLNVVHLNWNKPACHPSSGNKISHYNIYRSLSSSTWAHGQCQTGVPASSGLSYAFFSPTENDTTATDYTVISLPNNTNCSYAVVAVYDDCSESYASNVSTAQLVIGIKEITRDAFQVEVFPNPTSGDQTKVQISPTRNGYFNLELFDINGRLLKTLNPIFVNESNVKVNVDLSGLEKGYYFLKVEGENLQNVYKPIIKL